MNKVDEEISFFFHKTFLASSHYHKVCSLKLSGQKKKMHRQQQTNFILKKELFLALH